jgi:anti-anti-sigma regulatory factor
MQAIAPGWELCIDRGPDCLCVRIESLGSLASQTPPLADEIVAAMQRHLVHRLVLELDEIHLLHSYLVGQLILLEQRIRNSGGLMRLTGLSDCNRQVLETHGLKDRFAVYNNRAEATMGVSRRLPR